MNAIALQEPVLKLKGPVTDWTLLGKTFIWLPFAGGISAFAVILPKPLGTGHEVGGGYPDASHGERMLCRETRSKNWQQFRFFMSGPVLHAMGIIFNEGCLLVTAAFSYRCRHR
jgi:hypothetical protein